MSSGLGRFLRAALAVAGKDLRIELRAKEVIYSMIFFAALVVLLCGFAFTREGQSDLNAVGGVMWITVALTGTLGLNRAMDREREGGTMRALLLAPVDRTAIYVGKLLGITVFMLLAELVAVPLVALLFGSPILQHAGPLAVLLALGTFGYAAVGSLFAAMLARARGRDVLLGLLLYPVVIPILLMGVRGTESLLASPVDLQEAWQYAGFTAVFDAVYFVAALWVYEPLIASD